MNKLAAVIFAAVVLCGCSQKKYDYATFAWPENATHGVMIYWDAQGVQETETNLDLDAVLDQAQNLGWEYAGSVGHTCIMRRPQRTQPASGTDMSGDFVVETSPN